MKKNRSHIAAFICGSLLFLPLLLIFLLQAFQYYLKNTAFERMDDRQLQTVVVEESKVVWREANREVTIDGEYFDLVSWELKDGFYSFTGVYDEEETAVMELLGKQQTFWKSIISLLLIGQCFGVFILYIIELNSWNYLNRTFRLFENRYRFLYLRIISPPPRL